ncbi:MAG: adenylosuccinate synthase [Candidatus Methanoplasma sp.]|jgi:adenylosuccinate synthase|nr:adenylosuccinate synthase [Candidatus Methanoplasma sp.]
MAMFIGRERLENTGAILPGLAIIGAQWGDEGKGKITDCLGEDAEIIVRFQGGNNAGHTIIVGDRVFKLHGLPSGVVREGKLAVIGNGAVVNMDELLDEMDQVVKAGGSVDGLRISDRAHLILNYHKKLDGAEEKYRGSRAVGTTKKGIGPSYQDKIARIGIRAGDLLEDDIREKADFNLPYKKDMMAMLEAEPCGCDTDMLFGKLKGWRDKVGRYICDTSVLINEALDTGRNVLFEGAQGAMLDIDHGTYPYVTSSSTCSGGICTGAGVAPNRIGKVIGCLKAYTTRVGEGPLVTELSGEEAEILQRKGGEFGVTTGRGRRCGWLDLVVAEHSSRICGFSSLAITKLDVLSDYEELPVCTAYRIDGKETKYFPASISRIEKAEPIYKIMNGWKGWNDTDSVVRGGYDALPDEMKRYVEFIEQHLNIPAEIISIGPDRNDTIYRKKDWWNSQR